MSILMKRLVTASLGAVALFGTNVGPSAAADLSILRSHVPPARADLSCPQRIPQTYPPAGTYLCPPTVFYQYTPPPEFVGTPYGLVYADHPYYQPYGPFGSRPWGRHY
jgi:hypothetical protein